MHSEEALIEVKGAALGGCLSVPTGATGLVVFAHGSGSSRLSPRNKFVARVLNDRKVGTLLVDLLTQAEDEYDSISGKLRFDVEFLGNRLSQISDWVSSYSPTQSLIQGLFGASTGAAAALITAAKRPERIQAVTLRGGRPDLALEYLSQVRCPTLFIVGERDGEVLSLNKRAKRELKHVSHLVTIPRATHLFEEPGTLEQVAGFAARWFAYYLRPEKDFAKFIYDGFLEDDESVELDNTALNVHRNG